MSRRSFVSILLSVLILPFVSSFLAPLHHRTGAARSRFQHQLDLPHRRFLNQSLHLDMSKNDSILEKTIDSLQDIIGTDAGNRGMKSLICLGDLWQASTLLASISSDSHVLVLSGFPCCVDAIPPTETDGPPGAVALVRTAHASGSSPSDARYRYMQS